MHPLCHPDPQKTDCSDRPSKKENSSLKDIHSCEHLFKGTSCTLRKSAHERKSVAINDTDATSNCQPFLEGMHEKMHRYNNSLNILNRILSIFTLGKAILYIQFRILKMYNSRLKFSHH